MQPQRLETGMKKSLFVGICLCAMALSVMADDVRKPETQIADNTFFDPTRKQADEKPYQFGVEYRIEVGFTQHQQRTDKLNYADMYLHGARLGANVTFLLPKNFSLQTGLLYTIVYGRQQQHWRSMDAPSVQEEYINHRILEHNFTIPVRCVYTFSVWRDLNIFLYGGPQLHIGLAENDYMKNHLSAGTEAWLQTQGIPTEPYDRMAEELWRANIQMGVGAGLEWQRYRLQGGYDFGLNNQVKKKLVSNQHMWEWGWYVSFCYKL